jgi:hypothetical protein
MSDTREKLGEATYFYNQMVGAHSSGDPNHIYLMNAFISAARSVTFVMEREYANAEGFKQWWTTNKQKVEPAFSRFNDLRTITEHQKVINRSGNVWSATFNFGEGVDSKDGVVKVGFNFEGDKPRAFVLTTDENGKNRELDGIAGPLQEDFIVTEYRSDNKTKIKIDSFLKDARTYFETLNQIIDECEKMFHIQ